MIWIEGEFRIFINYYRIKRGLERLETQQMKVILEIFDLVAASSIY